MNNMNEVLESILSTCFLYCSINKNVIISKLGELTSNKFDFSNYEEHENYIEIRPAKNNNVINTTIKLNLTKTKCINNIEIIEAA